jgi:hypothetical protein
MHGERVYEKSPLYFTRVIKPEEGATSQQILLCNAALFHLRWDQDPTWEQESTDCRVLIISSNNL